MAFYYGVAMKILTAQSLVNYTTELLHNASKLDQHAFNNAQQTDSETNKLLLRCIMCNQESLLSLTLVSRLTRR
jgi:hypothetical protein